MSSAIDVEALLDSAAAKNAAAKAAKDGNDRNDRELNDQRRRDRDRDRGRDRDHRRDSSRDRKRRERSRPRSGYGKDQAPRLTPPSRRTTPTDDRGYRRRSRSRTRSPRGDSRHYRPSEHRGRRDRDRDRARYGRRDRSADRYRDGRDRRRSRERHEREDSRGAVDRYDPRRDEPRKTPEPTEDERDRRTIFVQQLAARLRTRDLIAFFSRVGEVKEAQIVKDRISLRSKGVGYVEFKHEESVAKAIELTGQKLLGIPIIAQMTEAEKNRQARPTEGNGNANSVPYHRLYVGNIHFSVTEEDLSHVFEPFGELEFVQLQKEEQGRSKGYGFVQFVNADHAKQALEAMNGFELAGRPIRVGLGNDKFTPESTANLLRTFGSQQPPSFQGSSVFGHGGRGAHAGGSGGAFDRASGRDNDRGAGGASALDDSDVGGVNFNNYSREALMRKLARIPDDPPANGASKGGQSATAARTNPFAHAHAASRCIKLQNMFDPEEVQPLNWIKELEKEVREECEYKFGKVVHLAVDQNSQGDVYVKFEKVEGGEKAIKGLNGRFFAGRTITAVPVVDKVYASLFGRATAL